jgi:hypothetical protein
VTDPTLIPRNSLAGVRVGLSVSDSADLGALGLSIKHCEFVVAEITRGILLAGGTVVYGGRLEPEGYTRILLDEIQRFQEDTASIEIVLAESEFRKMEIAKLDRVAQRLGTLGRLRFVLANGDEVKLANISRTRPEQGVATALTAMRRFVAKETHARVIVGGKLAGYQGSEPGLIEEARLSLEAGGHVYAAGGYGGAAALIAKARSRDQFAWAPENFPRGYENEDVQAALNRLVRVDGGIDGDGLDAADRAVLNASHRPADIASTVVRGLSRSTRPTSTGTG